MDRIEELRRRKSETELTALANEIQRQAQIDREAAICRAHYLGWREGVKEGYWRARTVRNALLLVAALEAAVLLGLTIVHWMADGLR